MKLATKDFETALEIVELIAKKWRRFSIFKLVLTRGLHTGNTEGIAVAARRFADAFEEDSAADDAEIAKLFAEAEEARK